MSAGEQFTRAPGPAASATVAAAIAVALARAPGGSGRLHVPALLQSWPGMAHGGGVIALLDAAAGMLGVGATPRVLEGRLTAPVPTDTPLSLECEADEHGTRLAVLRDGQCLASAAIGALETSPSATPAGPSIGMRTGAAARATAAAPPEWRGGEEGWPLPVSEHCLACGADNPIGLRAELRFDDEGVWTRVPARPPWRAADGGWHPAVAPVLLDEVAWWLGALVMQEGGLTNRIRVTLHRPNALVSGPLVGAGRFDAVTPIDRRRTFWRTETALLGTDGILVATATIVFRGGAEYSAPQLDYFRRRTSAEVFGRMFRGYAR